MILSDKEIRAYSKKQVLPLITPFVEEQLQGASYDISMSGNIIVMKRAGKPINPMRDDDLRDMYERISVEGKGYLLSPGEYVLVELAETVNIPEKMVAHIRPRTRFTRSGILIADQHCNPTYSGVLSIGLFNAGVNTFLLQPKLRIAQMIFEEIESVPSEDKLYKNKKNAAFEGEKEFRESKFGEAGWSDAGKKLYNDILASLEEGDKE